MVVKLPLFILQHNGIHKIKTSLFHGYVKRIEIIIRNLAVQQVTGLT